MTTIRRVWLAGFAGVSIWCTAAGYSQQKPLPDFTKGDTIDLTQTGVYVDWNLGATGARGWVYGWFGSTDRSRQILITKVHEGSPADGILQKGDVILGIAGTPFGSDARKAFGMALTQAETREGKGQLQLLCWRGGKTGKVTIQLKVLGSYSDTTPWDCEKSQKILDNACAYLIRNGNTAGGDLGIPAMIRTLALMATGDPKYMPIVRAHIDTIVTKVAASGKEPPVWSYQSWGWAYTNLLLCEYHLLTKDPKVLLAIRKYSTALALGQGCNGRWGHGMALPDPITGKPHGEVGGYGSMNQITTICWMSLVLAKRCGMTDPEIDQAIVRGHEVLCYFIDIGTITYGDNLSLDSLQSLHDDNGKNSAAAVAFAMFGDKQGTRFFSRMTVASYEQRENGHTGNYFSFLWGALGAARAGPQACGAFLREHCWLYDLERRWDGGFVYQGQGGNGNGYDPKTGKQRNHAGHQYPEWDTTGSRILMYCLPRKKLVITGRDTYTAELTAADVADTIDAPHTKYGGLYTQEELLKRLGSWSPVARVKAASELASRIRKGGTPISVLTDRLRGPDRYARYGACRALRFLGPKAQPAVDDLIACLGSADRVLQIDAVSALGSTDDTRAVHALLKMAVREFPDDTFDVLHRYLALALFGGKDSLVEKSSQVADRAPLLAAAHRFLRSVTGHCRTLMAENVTDTLALAEVRTLWPDLQFAFYQPATSYNTAIQMEVLRLMAKYHIKEGMDRCVWYLTNQKGHGSEKRVPEVLKYLLEYGAHAKSIVPMLKKTAEYFDLIQDKHTVAELTKLAADFDVSQVPEAFPRELSKKKATQVRDTIRALEAMDDQQKAEIKLISLADKPPEGSK